MRSTRLLLLAVVMGSSLQAHSQLRHGPRLGFVLASTGYAFMQQSGLLKPGVLAGYGADVHLRAGLSLMPELLYITKGNAARDVYQKVKSRTYLNYIEMPLMVKFDTDKKSDGFYITAGVYGAYLLSQRFLNTMDGIVTQDTQYDLSQSSGRFDYGAGFGFGVQGKSLSFELRAGSSLAFFDLVVPQRNTVYAMLFTYRFALKEERAEEPGEEE